nr:CatA-like O-acetyltransferase [Cellulosilyticum ruminicola]
MLYEDLEVSFTYLNLETEVMKNIVAPMEDDIDTFIEKTKQIIATQKVYFTGPVGNGVYQFSVLPWISFTHISHTNSGKKYNAVPMFDWGKFYEKDGKIVLPFSIEAHHSFVDGIHMGKLAEKLQAYLSE